MNRNFFNIIIKKITFCFFVAGVIGCGGGTVGASQQSSNAQESSSLSVITVSSVESSRLSSSAESSVISSSLSTSSKSNESSSIGLSSSSESYNATYIQVNQANQHVFLFINGVERMRWGKTSAERWYNPYGSIARLGERIDITSLLGRGDNIVKLVVTSNESAAAYGIKLWHDGNLIIDVAENFVSRANDFTGIIYEKMLTLNSNLPLEFKTLTITSNFKNDAIYINNVFTGKASPAVFTLSSGEYRIGIGESTTTPDWINNTTLMTGQYREKDIIISTENITLNSLDLPFLQKVNERKVAIIAYTNVHHGLTDSEALQGMNAAANDIGLMTKDDILVAEKSVQVTSDKWITPMTYGLMKWKVTVLNPIVRRVYRTDHLRTEDIQYEDDLSQYDMIIHVIADLTNNINSNGKRLGVVHGIGGAGGRPDTYMPASWLDGDGTLFAERMKNVNPSQGMVHESLHNLDGFNLNDYNGLGVLHGGATHGFTYDDCGLPGEWVCWYQLYFRGQVPENKSLRHEVDVSQKVSPENTSLFVGDFNLLRSGQGVEQLWSFSKPIKSLKNLSSGFCLYSSSSGIDAQASVSLRSCGDGLDQEWAFKHIQNGAYQFVSESNNKCVEYSQGVFQQKNCDTSIDQRFLLISKNKDGFNIKTLSGLCLMSTDSGIGVTEICSDSPANLWQYK